MKLNWIGIRKASVPKTRSYMRYPLDFGDLKTLKTFIQNVVNKDAVQVFRDCKFVDPYVA